MMPRPLRITALLSAVALPLLAACSAPDKTATLPLGAGGTVEGDGPKLPLAVIAALDSGNNAMRIDDYTRAVAQYRAAIAGAPTHAAPWFGLYMAAKEMQDSALADSALSQVRALTNDVAVLPAHEEVADVAMPSHSGGVLPGGHPKTNADGSPIAMPSPRGTTTPVPPRP